MSLETARTGSLELGTVRTATAGLESVSLVAPGPALGFEASEAWGSPLGNASISTERPRTGERSMKVDGGIGGALTLAQAIGPEAQARVASLWVYFEAPDAGSAQMNIHIERVGRFVTFARQIAGMAPGSWTHVVLPVTTTFGPDSLGTIHIKVTLSLIGAPVAYIDDLSFPYAPDNLEIQRVSTLELQTSRIGTNELETL